MNTQKNEDNNSDYNKKIDEFESKIRNRFTVSGSSLLGESETISNLFEKDESTYDNYVVVTVDFERATLREASSFKKFLETVISSEDNKGIVVNLNKCEFIDSSFFGVLVGAVKRIKIMNRNFFLVYDNEHQLPIFSATGLDKVFTVFNSVEEAVQK